MIRHLLIRGRVQGVGYRYSMATAARQMGVTGWVRNRRDGSVEAMAQADAEALDRFIEWAKVGPSLAHVEGVDVSEGSGEFASFEIRDTA